MRNASRRKRLGKAVLGSTAHASGVAMAVHRGVCSDSLARAPKRMNRLRPLESCETIESRSATSMTHGRSRVRSSEVATRSTRSISDAKPDSSREWTKPSAIVRPPVLFYAYQPAVERAVQSSRHTRCDTNTDVPPQNR